MNNIRAYFIVGVASILLSACAQNSIQTQVETNKLSVVQVSNEKAVKNTTNNTSKNETTESQLRLALKEAEDKYGKESKQTHEALYKLIFHIRKNPEKRDELITLFDRIISVSKKLHGDKTNETAFALASAGIVMAKQGDFKYAEPLLSESLDIYASVGVAKQKNLITLLDTLANLYLKTGRHEKALPLLGRSLRIYKKHYGLEHYGVVIRLNKLGRLHKRAGNYKQALTFYQEALTINKKMRGIDSTTTASSMNELAKIYKKLGKLNKALPLFQEALSIRQKKLGIENILSLSSLNSLVEIYTDMGKYAQALTLSQKSLDISTRKWGAVSKFTAMSLNNQAEIYEALQQYDKAMPLYQRALSTHEKVFGSAHIGTAMSLNNLASLHKKMGNFDKSLPLYQQAMYITERVLGLHDVITARSINNLATIYEALGLYDKALPLFKKALSIRENVLGLAHPETAGSLNNLAHLYKTLGEYSKALSLYQRSLLIYETIVGKEHAGTAKVMNNIAGLYYRTGEYAKALPLFQSALRINKKVLGHEHVSTAISLSNLADLYRTLGQYENSLFLLKQALSIDEKVLGPMHVYIATDLNNIAVLYNAKGEYEKALPPLRRTLHIHQKVLGSDHVSTANSLNNLALIYQNIGRHDKALQLFTKSLSIKERLLGPSHPDTINVLNNLGFLYIDIKNYKDAGSVLNKAITLSQQNLEIKELQWRMKYGLHSVYKSRNQLSLAIFWGKEAVNNIQDIRHSLNELSLDVQSSFLNTKRHVYQDLADLLITEGRIGEAQTILQMLKEQELHDIVQRSSGSIPLRTRIELTGLEQKRFARYYELQDQQIALGKERVGLQRKQKLGEITQIEKQRLKDINELHLPPLRDAMIAFLQALQKQSDQYTKDKAYRQGEAHLATVETNLQKAMAEVMRNDQGAKVAALQYVVTDTRLSILLSTPNNPPIARQIKFDGKALWDQITTVRELLIASVSSENDPAILNKHLQTLYQQLINPINAELKELEVETLILVPNDVLRYVPFAALYDGKRYLIQDYTLTLFNEAVKKDFAKQSKGNWQLAAMGLTRAVANLPALKHVSKELEAVAQKSGLNGKMYLDDAFTRKQLLESLNQQFTMLHLASHFEFVAGRPDASRFFLGDRSSLYLGDIARENMRFDKFSLVTFSACETGLGGGIDADGKEMESLGALVQNQGASAVMATLWKVADSSTSELMELFYRYYHEEKLTKAQALRKAQLRFIKGKSSGRRGWSRPYFWAPFVLMGDWR